MKVSVKISKILKYISNILVKMSNILSQYLKGWSKPRKCWSNFWKFCSKCLEFKIYVKISIYISTKLIWIKISNIIRSNFWRNVKKLGQNLKNDKICVQMLFKILSRSKKSDNNKIFNAKAFFAGGGAWQNRGAYDTLALSLTLPHFPSISRNHLWYLVKNNLTQFVG